MHSIELNATALDAMAAGFMHAAAFTSHDADAAGLEHDDLLAFDYAAVTRDNVRRFCETWAHDNAGPLAEYIAAACNDTAQTLAYLGGGRAIDNAWHGAGIDLYLTAAGHGAGFRDRGAADFYLQLDDAADYRPGQLDLYIGDNGALYIGGMESDNAPLPEKWG